MNFSKFHYIYYKNRVINYSFLLGIGGFYNRFIHPPIPY